MMKERKNRLLNLLPFASCLLPLLNLLPFASCLLPILATTTSVNGQIIPDGTLPNNTIVAPNGQTINIEGGTRAGGNLFHSFQEFNLGAGSTAFFNNGVDIQNILSRVTGGNISNIDGLIRANGAANLFLVNPAGIVFGPNARLNIGGSFLATSAESVVFNDGSFFSATEPNAPPLLTVNVPIGLQLGNNPGAITVRGTGHNLTRQGIGAVDRTEQLRLPAGLELSPGNTFAIVGGDITLESGVLTALEGQIELGSVKGGNVSIEGTGNLGYENAGEYGDILLLSKSFLDTSSVPGGGSAGSIRLRGRNIELRGGSQAFNQNLGSEPSGNTSLNATESINLIGSAPSADGVGSTLLSQTLGLGDGGNVELVAPRLLLKDGGGMGTSILSQEVLSPPRAGDVNIQASEFVEITGFSPFNTATISVIGSLSLGTGTAGNITLTTGQLRILNGGSLSSSALTGGEGGGNLRVNADTIEVIGIEPNTFSPSTINVLSLSEGEAGNLIINTRTLAVKDGGRVGASTGSSGPAGSLTINASESVEVAGTVPGSINPSIIDSSATIFDEAFQQLFSLPPVPTGDTGEATINTPFLRVADGGLVGVQHEGTGNAGTLRINAGAVLVEGGGGITAESASGFGGNLSLDIADSLLLRDGGSITAEAGGGGDGGNLTVNAGTIVLLRNSNINANAFEGSGGNIRISTEGLFPSADSAITASSRLGVDGTVEVEGLDHQASKGLVEVSSNLPDLAALIASGCEEYANSEFIITGRGGLPPTPSEAIALTSVWQDTRDLEVRGQRFEVRGQRLELGNQFPIPHSPFPIPQLVEATGWVRRPDGGIELVANPDPRSDSWYNYPQCGGDFK